MCLYIHLHYVLIVLLLVWQQALLTTDYILILIQMDVNRTET